MYLLKGLLKGVNGYTLDILPHLIDFYNASITRACSSMQTAAVLAREMHKNANLVGHIRTDAERAGTGRKQNGFEGIAKLYALGPHVRFGVALALPDLSAAMQPSTHTLSRPTKWPGQFIRRHSKAHSRRTLRS